MGAAGEDKSRSQIKREHLELKELGKRLVDLSRKQLSAVPLTEETREAVLAAKEMKKNALQRQYRFLATRLTAEDVPAIRAAMTDQLRPHAEEVAALHEAEGWRDRLLSEETEALSACVETFPHCDRRHLSQLARNARKERELEKPPKSARLLLRYLRELIEERGAPS